MLAAFIAVIGTVSVNAQTSFGLKGGLNLASITGDDVDELDGRTSFHFGGVVEIEISEKFSFQPELVYSAQGASESYDEEGFDIETTIMLDYLNIPLMAKYYVTDGLSLELGPQIGFLLSSKFEVEFDGDSESEDIEDLSSVDFGLNLGLGYKFDSGLNFGARYNLGLSNLDDTDSDESIKNGVFQVSLGYFF